MIEDDPLFARVLENPDDADLRLVWADALMERGDPWGELIALQAAARTRPLTSAESQRVRSLTARHRLERLGELVDVLQHRDGLLFDRGLLDECLLRVKSLEALRRAVGHPLWATVRRLWCTDHYAWDARIVPLLTHPVLGRLRDLLCVGMHNVLGPLGQHERPLPLVAIWTIDDSFRERYAPLGRGLDGEAPALHALKRLGFTMHRDATWILDLPMVRRIEKLGLTVEEPAVVWLERAEPIRNLRAIELRPGWIPLHGPRRSHSVLRFARGADGRFSHLTIEQVGRPQLHMLVDHLDGLAPDDLERIEISEADPELLACLARFRRAELITETRGE